MWQRIDPSILVGAPPAPRHCHSAVSYGDKVVSFGGTDGKNRFNDVYILDTGSFFLLLPFFSGFRFPLLCVDLL
jgi:hypothetical protein